MVGVAWALGKVVGLVVLHGHLGAEKLNFAVLLPQPFFELLYKLCRDWSGRIVISPWGRFWCTGLVH